ncbi:MAG TPA: NAD-dependent epimerase/dehydratase family protein [Candidatus Limnocylindria bacterium]
MRVLVAGGAGFVGSHLVELLVEQGDHVTVVDNLLTGSTRNLAHLARPSLDFVRQDAESAPDGNFDRVYHLASPASPEAYGRNQVATLMANSAGTKHLLDVAARAGARFLMASTSEVYGDPLVHPQPESYWGNVDPIGPRSMYDEAKRFAEALVVAYVRERGADARISRIFNAYGPRMQLNDGRMPSTFIAAAIRGEPIPVHGDGSQTRSLCYVMDTARGLIATMERGTPGSVYNIGRADEVSVLEFAQIVARATGRMTPIHFVPRRPQDIQRRCPDTTMAERDLGWRATTPIDEGLRATLAWYRDALMSPLEAGRQTA